MGIFGKLDAAAVKTNPFFIEEGTYEAEVTKAEYKINRDGAKQLVLQYTIDESESAFNGKTASQYFTLPDENLDAETFLLLPPDERAKTDKVLSSLKRTLCGNAANQTQRGLGVSEDDLNEDDWDPKSLVGTRINLGISNWGAEGVNIKFVNIIVEDE